MTWYSALVDDNDDPDRLGRLKLVVPSLWGDAVYDAWVPMLGGLGAAAVSDQAAGSGLVWIPPRDSIVLVFERDGRLAWTGGGWGRTNAMPSQLAEHYPDRAGWTSPAGDVWLAADDVDGLHLVANGDGDAGNARLAAGGTLALSGDSGGVEVVPGAGQSIRLTSTAGSTPTDRVILGDAFLQDLASLLTELVAGLSSIPASSTQAAAMLVKVNLALGAGSPYLSAITRTD